MIAEQLITWILLSFFSGFITYLILTEGKNRFLFVISTLFSVLLGFGAGYLWLQITQGLEQYSSFLFILPLIISCFGNILLLSYYKEYHGSSAFPRIPSFSVSRASSMVSIVLILGLSILLASFYMPTGAPTPAISMLGSTGSTVLDESDVADISECIDCMKSNDILMQKNVLSATSFRSDPKVGEYLRFKVEFPQSYSFLSPTAMVYVKDIQGKLVSSANIISEPITNGVKGEIYCDKEGIYTITAVIYDSMVSTNTPLASNTLSYTVFSDSEGAVVSPADSFTIYAIFMLVTIVLFIWGVAVYKKYF